MRPRSEQSAPPGDQAQLCPVCSELMRIVSIDVTEQRTTIDYVCAKCGATTTNLDQQKKF
jgi:hypothetical protein